MHDLFGGQAQDRLDLHGDFVRPGHGKIHLVEDRNDFQIGVDGQPRVRGRLRFDALSRIDEKDGAFAGRHAARDLIAEIDVPRGVDQVHDIGDAVFLPMDLHGFGLDGDAAFTLEIHVVEELVPPLSFIHGARDFHDPVGEGGLAVVDVRDDAEIPNPRCLFVRFGHQKLCRFSMMERRLGK